MFLACSTQWRIAPMGGITGLDYAAVESVMRMMRIKGRAEVFEGLRVMENAALAEISRQRR